MRPRVWLQTSILLLLTSAGCEHRHKVDPQQFDAAIARIDRWITVLDEAIRDLSGTLKEAQATLLKLEKELKTDTQDVLANEVRNVARSVLYTGGDQLKMIPDYLEIKIKDNLKVFRAALAQARKEVLEAKAKNDTSGIQRALDKLAEIKVFHDPVATGFVPNIIEVAWNDHDSPDHSIRVPVIDVHGWGFERPPMETPLFSLAIENAKGESRPLPSSAIMFQSRYQMQIKLSTPGVEFTKNDHALVFAWGAPGNSPQVSKLSIEHKILRQPELVEAPPVPMITALNVTIQTTKDDKDPEITFLLQPHLPGSGERGRLVVGGTRPELLGQPRPEFLPAYAYHEVWPNGHVATVQIRLAKPIPVRDRLKYALLMQYQNPWGNHGWEGRIERIQGVVSNGPSPSLELIDPTPEFKLGENGNPRQYEVHFSK